MSQRKASSLIDIGMTLVLISAFLMSVEVVGVDFNYSWLMVLGGGLLVLAKFKTQQQQNIASGCAISQQAQNELERIYEATGYTAHKVSSTIRFNGYIKSEGNQEAQSIERLLLKYSSDGFVFTKGESLIGKISTVPTKDVRAKIRRSRFKVITGLKN